MTVALVVKFKHTHSEAVSRLVVRESWLCNSNDASILALETTSPAPKRSQKCLSCGKPEHFERDCRKRTEKRKKHERNDGRKGINCREGDHIEKICPEKYDEHENGNDRVDIAMVTVASSALKMTGSSLSFNKWMLNLCFLKHM